jgi:hypothetical protein
MRFPVQAVERERQPKSPLPRTSLIGAGRKRSSIDGMKAAILAIVLLALSGCLQEPRKQSAPQVPSPAVSSSGRYQLVTATFYDPADHGPPEKRPTVLLIDTQSGDVWEYMEPGPVKRPDGTMEAQIPFFLSIEHGPSVRFYQGHAYMQGTDGRWYPTGASK